MSMEFTFWQYRAVCIYWKPGSVSGVSWMKRSARRHGLRPRRLLIRGMSHTVCVQCQRSCNSQYTSKLLPLILKLTNWFFWVKYIRARSTHFAEIVKLSAEHHHCPQKITFSESCDRCEDLSRLGWRSAMDVDCMYKTSQNRRRDLTITWVVTTAVLTWTKLLQEIPNKHEVSSCFSVTWFLHIHCPASLGD